MSLEACLGLRKGILIGWIYMFKGLNPLIIVLVYTNVNTPKIKLTLFVRVFISVTKQPSRHGCLIMEKES